MRPQPSIEVVLKKAAESLERAATATSDGILADQVLIPVAVILHRVARDFDTYVSERLAEIDRLALLARSTSTVADAEDAKRLDRLVEAASRASGYVPARELDDLADAFHWAFLAVQEKFKSELVPEGSVGEVREQIWAEQRRSSYVPS